MMQHHKYSLDELDNMIPWERQIYVTLLSNWIQEENERRAKEEAKSNDIDDVAVGDGSEQVDPADLTNSMAAYTAAISKTKDIKLSNK